MGEIVGTLLFFTLVFMFLAFWRFLRYKETIALADRGLVRPSRWGNGRDTLRWGIVMTALGVALLIGLYPLGATFSHGQFPMNFGPWMLFGLLPAFFGLALILTYVVTRENDEGAHEADEELELELEDESSLD